ncbi:hypothetical protein CTI12_AA011720 [Artemisia annua]|uniref:Uncharacterized protein n=1 Tax=Artemisia annua TaxID=35608 RepID=A0A2U1QLI1_ARTAN|nr:hypothetical protein CTI12_AA011720 [Artemisia annua]
MFINRRLLPPSAAAVSAVVSPELASIMLIISICHHPPRHITGTRGGVFGLQRGLYYLHKRVVAQLLAIMYFVSNEEIPSPKVTCFQWACFFQQLTVGSDVNYSFSDKLREVYGVCDPDNTLHRHVDN